MTNRLTHARVSAADDYIDVVVIVKRLDECRHEYWIIMYDKENKREALLTCGRWAANPDLAFTWYDAATVSDVANESPEDNVAHVNGLIIKACDEARRPEQ